MVKVAEAAAPVPTPGAVSAIVTVGALVYPLPGAVIVKPVIAPVTGSTTAVAVAWVPPAGGAERVTMGAV
jgi:hypothetical protein